MLSWQASADTGGSGLAGYEVWARSTGSTGPFRRLAATTATSFRLSRLRRGATYRFSVVAYDQAGNRSRRSNIAAATAL